MERSLRFSLNAVHLDIVTCLLLFYLSSVDAFSSELRMSVNTVHGAIVANAVNLVEVLLVFRAKVVTDSVYTEQKLLPILYK